jgi:spore coat protein U-like protein
MRTGTGDPLRRALVRGARLLLWASALALALLALPARAQSCTRLTAVGVSFGAYNPLSSAPLDAAGSVSYSCSAFVRPAIMLSKGSSGTYNSRSMLRGSEPLSYNLYANAARSAVWGDGTGVSYYVLGPGGTQSVPIYGRIAPLQDVSAGSYLDTIIVTLNF